MLSYKDLEKIVSKDAVFRRLRRLQPAYGKGQKVYPATYPAKGPPGQGTGPGKDGGKKNKPAPRHVYERRRTADHGELPTCAVDSVQSQANRLEAALMNAIRSGAIEMPYLEVDYSQTGLNEPNLTDLEVPHRAFDAHIRDTTYQGKKFFESPIGQRILSARSFNATPLLEISPVTLAFGGWHSQGPSGGQGIKFPRCVVAEINAFNVPVDPIEDPRPGSAPDVVTAARKTTSRRDPMNISKKAPVFVAKGREWESTLEAAGDGAKAVNPSVVNHGNITPTIVSLGITLEWAEQIVGITLAGLRHLSFGDVTRNSAGRTYLAALLLLAVVEQDEQGLALRSNCDFVGEEEYPAIWERVQPDGKVHKLEIGLEGARKLYREALKAASDAGFSMHPGPILLTPQPKVVEAIRKSRDPAFKGGEADEDEAEE